MSDGSLSQDEIDALLQGTDEVITDTPFALSGEGESSSIISDGEKNAFLEVIRSAASNQGSALGALLNKQVTIANPKIEVLDKGSLQDQLPEEIVEVKIDFEEGIIGEHLYILNVEDAEVIAGLMMGQEKGELTDASLSAIEEAMNTLVGNSITTMSRSIPQTIRSSPPKECRKQHKSAINFPAEENFVKVSYDLNIEGADPSTLIEVFSSQIVRDIAQVTMPAQPTQPAQAQPPGPGPQQPMQTPPAGQPMMPGFQQPMQPQAQPGGFMPMGQPGMAPYGQPVQQVPVSPVQFSNLQSQESVAPSGNIGLLMDVNMEMTVELGRTRKLIKDILGMGEGTIIELDKLAGEPVDILVNQKLIARGEVVVIDENFGVRVTEIVSPIERFVDIT